MTLVARRWRGFTLIELLVVIAIMGVLVALLLPAIQQAREAARRTSCANNLRQIAVAIANYQEQNKMFPAAVRGGVASVYMNFTGYAGLLPFLEQEGVSDLFNFDAGTPSGDGSSYYGWSHPANSTAHAARLPMFLCPSNRSSGSTPLNVILPEYNWSVGAAAVTDYLLSGGCAPYYTWEYADPLRRGIAGIDSVVRPSDVIDGLTKTFLIGESAGGMSANRYYAQGTGTDRVCVPVSKRYSEFGTELRVIYDNFIFQAYGRRRPNGDGTGVIGGFIAMTADRRGFFYPFNDCGYPTLSDAFTAPPADPAAQLGQQAPNFRSVHKGLVTMAMADSSVRTFADSVDRSVAMGLSTIAGGETVDGGW